MYIENPVALRFIMQDEIFLLNADRSLYSDNDIAAKHETAVTETAKIEQVTGTTEITGTITEIKYLGDNKTGFLILTHYPGEEFIHQTHLNALENILKRKGLEISDIAIVNMARYSDVKFETVINYLVPQKILLLGKNALPEGIVPLKLNELQQLAGYTMLYSFNFEEMMDSTDNKRLFWEQMKLL